MPYEEDYDAPTDFRKLGELSGVSPEEIYQETQSYDYLLREGLTDAPYEPLSAIPRSHDIGMTGQALEANIALVAKKSASGLNIRNIENIDEVSKKIGAEIMNEWVDGLAFDIRADRIVDLAGKISGKSVFAPKPSKPSISPKSKNAFLQFKIDTSEIDRMIERASGAQLFTKHDATKLTDLMYDKVAVDMARNAIYDLLVEKYAVVQKNKGNDRIDEASANMMARINQISLFSQSRIDFLVNDVFANTITKMATVESKRVTRLNDIIYDKLTSISEDLFEIRASFEAISFESLSSSPSVGRNKNIRSSQWIANNTGLVEQFMSIRNKLTEMKLSIYSFVKTTFSELDVKRIYSSSEGDYDKIIKPNAIKRESAISGFFMKYSGNNHFIFNIYSGIIVKMLRDVNEAISMTERPQNNPGIVNPLDKPIKTELHASYDQEGRRTLKLPKHVKLNPFTLDFESKEGELQYVYKVADNIETAFKAMGFDTPMISAIKAKLSSSIFERPGLMTKVENLVTNLISINLDKAFGTTDTGIGVGQ